MHFGQIILYIYNLVFKRHAYLINLIKHLNYILKKVKHGEKL